MIYIKKNGVVTNVGQGQEWLDNHITLGSFGSAAYSYQQETSPAVLAEDGTELSPAVYETVNVPAEYEIEIIGGTDSSVQDAINSAALAYLATTDFYIIREMDNGIPCPAEIREERQAARQRIV